ncbi:hypothetical protein HII31_01302 [Pseudocercospora fuligena]|uniref:Uncharacterized protein n=1 Tax=Pseudocercospora fuligena TaxID=685502 RepID=A0A8H6RU96_9PEZI|nr:hypothetical protein HII31_01302 [Pseudocercospora fuligena]
MRGLHQDMIKENIRINVVGPWMTRTNMTEFFADHWISKAMPYNSPADVASAILICSTANRGGAGISHMGAVLPFTGKIVFLGGGKSYEIEDRLQALQPQWFGEENTKAVALGDIFLNEMASSMVED